jgi:hypothetical protein
LCNDGRWLSFAVTSSEQGTKLKQQCVPSTRRIACSTVTRHLNLSGKQVSTRTGITARNGIRCRHASERVACHPMAARAWGPAATLWAAAGAAPELQPQTLGLVSRRRARALCDAPSSQFRCRPPRPPCCTAHPIFCCESTTRQDRPRHPRPPAGKPQSRQWCWKRRRYLVRSPANHIQGGPQRANQVMNPNESRPANLTSARRAPSTEH